MNLKNKFHLGKLCFLFLLQEENPSQRTVKDSFFIDSNKDKIKIQTHYKSSAGKINIRIYFKLFYVVYHKHYSHKLSQSILESIQYFVEEK